MKIGWRAEELLPITTSSGRLVWSSALDIDPSWRVPRNRVSFTPHALQGLSIVYRWNEGGPRMFDDRMSAPIDFRKRYRPYIYILPPLSSRSSRRSFRFVRMSNCQLEHFCSKRYIFIRTATQYRFYWRWSSILVDLRV